MILLANLLSWRAELENSLETTKRQCYYLNGQSDYFY
jgi:hypothetical protein